MGGSWPRVASLTPGRALDVGCGEGADAIWLARSGWMVTAIDISEAAVTRAREAAELAGAAVEWVRGDALQTPFPAGSFDLVSMQYPALPKAVGEAAVRALLDTVRPGGLLLAVYHVLNDEHRKHMKSQGVDPADYVDADDLVRLLGDAFTIELMGWRPARPRCTAGNERKSGRAGPSRSAGRRPGNPRSPTSAAPAAGLMTCGLDARARNCTGHGTRPGGPRRSGSGQVDAGGDVYSAAQGPGHRAMTGVDVHHPVDR